MQVTKDVSIIRMGSNAEGIAIINGKVAFIPFALPSEIVEVSLEKEFKKYNLFELKKITKKSDDRVISICPYYTSCGGCELQHLAYQKSLLYKEQNLASTIQKIAKIMVSVEPAISSLQKYNYRNKCAFSVEKVNNKTIVGYFKKGSKEVINIEQCAIAKYEINECYALIKRFVEDKNLGYDYYNGSGFIKHIVIRAVGDALQITIVSKSENVPYLLELVNLIKESFENFSLFLNVNKVDNSEIFSNNFKLVFGQPAIFAQEFGIEYSISPHSFLQINDYIKEQVYNQILSEINHNSVVVDAYSGSGLLTAIISKKARKVYGVEINKSASDDANRLVKLNGINNVLNINGDCAIELPKLVNKLVCDELNIVLDPARAGCDTRVLEAVCKSGARKLIYLSCNPSTLARDLIVLQNFYDIKKIQPYDMFPQTSNLETLVILERK